MIAAAMSEAKQPWIESSDVVAMFPTLVWKLQMREASFQAINAKIIAVLDAIRTDLPPLAAGLGWQSEQTLHRREEFAELVACVQHAAKGILSFLKVVFCPAGNDLFSVTDKFC